MGDFYKNQEGYADPTAGAALAEVIREEHRWRPLIYICSPYSGDPPGNTKKAIKYSRFAVDQGAIPLAPHLLLPLYMKEQTERELAMLMDMVFLGRCEELWVFGSNWSDGMQAEIAKAKKRQMKIRYFTEDCKEER